MGTLLELNYIAANSEFYVLGLLPHCFHVI